MNTNKIRIIAVICLLALVVGVFAACKKIKKKSLFRFQPMKTVLFIIPTLHTRLTALNTAAKPISLSLKKLTRTANIKSAT
jgi:predicted component of type VI protein secretion system